MIVRSNYPDLLIASPRPDQITPFFTDGNPLSQFQRDGVCLLKGPENKGLKEILASFGSPIDQSENGCGSYEFAICPADNPKAHVSSRSSQPLHMDALYRRAAPDIIVLKCVVPAAVGGHSTILGRVGYEGVLLELSSRHLDELRRPMAYCRQGRTYWRDNNFAATSCPLFRYSPYPGRLTFASRLQYEAWAHLAELIGQTPVWSLKLDADDCLILDNRVALHGRMAFEGERKLVRSWHVLRK